MRQRGISKYKYKSEWRGNTYMTTSMRQWESSKVRRKGRLKKLFGLICFIGLPEDDDDDDGDDDDDMTDIKQAISIFQRWKILFCVSGKTRLSASLEAKTNGAQCFFHTWEIQSHQGFRVMPRLRWDFLGGNSSDFIF